MGKLFVKKKAFDYFDYFQTCAGFACQAATYLAGALSAFDVAKVPQQVQTMHQIENDADVAKHQMLRALADEFMTPIEREDIIELAQDLDNVVDAIEDVMLRISMLNVKAVPTAAVAFAELIVDGCAELAEAVKEFRHFRKSKTITEHVVRVNTTESKGDKLFFESMHALFAEEPDTHRQVVWMNLYESLEHCLDACEDVADVIESVVMKNT
ncbi:MAG: DUF47 family protein [Oscillospiraceae bacterium]|jgi:uncharacterized protein Yka (UPF0111/DUF47 family)|nr:DUF47 family protein [Oscillospiraceae bacterium]